MTIIPLRFFYKFKSSLHHSSHQNHSPLFYFIVFKSCLIFLETISSSSSRNLHHFKMAGGKRSRKGKAKVTEEASQPEPPPVFNYRDGKFLWFSSRDMLIYFKARFEKREILPPRFMPLGNLPSLHSQDLLPHLDACHLSPFVSNTISFISKPLIRAFYSNLHDNDGTVVTSINGTNILLSEERLSFHTLLPFQGENVDLYEGTDDHPFNEILFLHEMGLSDIMPTSRRRPTVTKNMNPMHRTLFYLITRILKPRKYSHTTLTKEDIRLIHAIVNDVQLNWCKFILDQMVDASFKNDKPLPFAPLVMQLLEQHDIDMTEAPKIKPTKIWEVSSSSFKMQEEEEAPMEQQQPDQQAPIPQQVDFNSIMDKLNEMQLGINEKFNTMDARFTSMGTHMNEKFNTMESYMFGYFDHVGYTGYKEDIGQSSQVQGMEEEGNEEQEGDDEDDEDDDEETP